MYFHFSEISGNAKIENTGLMSVLTIVFVFCTLQHHQDDVNWCAFSAKLLATCSGDKTLRIYNSHDFSELPFSPLWGHGYSVHCCCFSACGQFLASCSTDATVVVWSMDTGEIEGVLEHPGRSPVRICALSPDSLHLVSGASDGSLALWDHPTKQLLCTLQHHQDDVNWCAFSAKLLATCSGDKTLRIYNSHDFSELPFSPLWGHGYSVHCCCFSACGQFLASCSTDATVVVWSMDTGEIEGVLEHPGRSPVRICALSPDSLHLVSGASDGSLFFFFFTGTITQTLHSKQMILHQQQQ
uniref:WD repeat, SAM and U-box domain-containing protein 1 n=1 Tax=Gouania willdenowi TaxID=441366 RepID=A0A8C5H6W6_GOUWI